MYLKSITTKSSNITNSYTWLKKHCRNSYQTPFILDHSKVFYAANVHKTGKAE